MAKSVPTLRENPSLVPSLLVGSLLPVTLAPGDLTPFGFCGQAPVLKCTYPHRHTSIHIIKQ